MQVYLDLTHETKEDIASYKRAGNKIALKKLLTLFEELAEYFFTGIGKPEPLLIIKISYRSSTFPT